MQNKIHGWIDQNIDSLFESHEQGKDTQPTDRQHQHKSLGRTSLSPIQSAHNDYEKRKNVFKEHLYSTVDQLYKQKKLRNRVQSLDEINRHLHGNSSYMLKNNFLESNIQSTLNYMSRYDPKDVMSEAHKLKQMVKRVNTKR